MENWDKSDWLEYYKECEEYFENQLEIVRDKIESIESEQKNKKLEASSKEIYG